MKKILITGGAGFIGSNLAIKLVELGYHVTVLDNLLKQIHGDKQDSSLYNSIKNITTFIRGDVCNKSDWEKAIKGQDAVVHLAAETGTGQSMYEAMEASRERVSQSLFTGAGTRGKDRAMRALSGAYEDTTKGLSKKLSKAESDAFVKQEGILRDTTMKRESEKRDWVGEVYKALGTMQSRGVEQRTKVDLDKYDGHGAGAPSDSWGDSHGDSYRDTSSNQTYKYHDPWGAASDGDWITWEQTQKYQQFSDKPTQPRKAERSQSRDCE